MHRYHVLRNISERDEIVLIDSHGRNHLARPIRDVPRVGTPLLGVKPALGLGILLDVDNSRAYKLIFEQLDCAGPEDQPKL